MRTLAKTSCLSVSVLFALTGAASLHAQVKILTDYERLTIAHGLSCNAVYCIFQDRRGFLWIGGDGLNRYDGNTFIVFRREPFDSTTLPENLVHAICEDRAGILWIGTPQGLFRFDPATETFLRYLHDPEDSTSLGSNSINALHIDRFGNLWIGLVTIDGLAGLNKLVLPSSTGLASEAESAISSTRDSPEPEWASPASFPHPSGSASHTPANSASTATPTNHQFIRYDLRQNNSTDPKDGWVRFILEDSTGTLWLGTETGGLKKFDPRTGQVTHYNHDPNDPNSISGPRVWGGCRDRSDALWLGIWDAGLDKFDPVSGKVTHYRNDPERSESLSSHYALSVYEDRSGTLWIGSGALSQFDPRCESFAHYTFTPNFINSPYNSDFISYLYEDRSGILWIGTVSNGLIKLDRRPKKFSHYRHDPENPGSLRSNDVRSLYEDKLGNIWIVLYNNGVCRFDPRSEQFTHFQHDPRDPATLSHRYVRPICEDRFGNLWFGTCAGLDRFDPRTEKFVRVKCDSLGARGLNSSTVMTIYEDKSGTIWFGTYGSGLYKIARLPGSRTRPGRAWTTNSPSPSDNGAAHIIQYRHDPKDSTSMSSDGIWDIHEDRFGNFWVVTSLGINLMDRQTGKFVNLTKGLKPSEYHDCRKIYEDRNGKIWAPSSAGLGRIDIHASESPREIRDSTNYSQSSPVISRGYRKVPYPFEPVYGFASFYVDREGMGWAGGADGLFKFDPVTEKFIAHYSKKDGLASSAVPEIAGDDQGNLWLLTGKGLSIFNEKAAPGQQFRNFDLKDGVINSPSAIKGLLKASDGTIYWGGSNGLYRFFPENLKNNPHVPPVVLTEFRVFNETVKLDSAISAKKQIELAHDQNSFSFSFAALDFIRPLSNQYAYRLEGIDQDWIEAGNRRYANYTHIPPGEYIFRVKGANNDGVWNEVGASIKIIITPPYWQTWWFRLLALGVFVGLLEALHKYRVAKKLEIEATRNRIARDLHDDIGSSLSNIALMSELMQGKRTLEEKEIKQLRQIGATSRQIVEAMEDIVWAINPDHDKLDNLLLRLKDVAAELLQQQGITYTFHFPEQELLQSLPMNFRRNLLLIYKELLHNVMKHAQATHVDIALAKTDGCLVLKLADDGVGFDPKAVRNGNGLKSMQTRAAELKGKLEIESQPNQGTRVTLAVKL
jgi:signal transduction histidine kinase/ligand-binding sensor domain-containing protein